jgi:archaellum component FlaF (FlaF/FlaG flagellin family)
MKKLFTISLVLIMIAKTSLQAQQAVLQPVDEKITPGMTEIWDPEVTIVQSGATDSDAPSDAVVLFNGTDINSEWMDSQGNPSKWIVKDGALVSVKGAGVIKTKLKFSNFQLHIEWKTPSEVTGESQGRGNSGVFLQELYEVQVLDSYNNRTYRNGQAGSLYKQHAPLVNVSRKPGEWQSYDIIYTAPTFNNDTTTFFTPPRVTVLHNGVLVQNNVSLRGPTVYIGIPEYFIKKHGPGSLVLQDHGNPVAYRNIWIREL